MFGKFFCITCVYRFFFSKMSYMTHSKTNKTKPKKLIYEWVYIVPGIPFLTWIAVQLRGQHGGGAGAAAGIRQFLLQPHHLLLHEQEVPAGLYGHLRLLQVCKVTPKHACDITLFPSQLPLVTFSHFISYFDSFLRSINIQRFVRRALTGVPSV